MKAITTLIALFLTLNLIAQEEEKIWQNEFIAGYTINNLGESYNLLYGIGTSKHLFYGGLRLQEHSPVNMFDPLYGNIYRYDNSGFPIGLILGYQRKFNPKNFSITPFAYADIEYAYLNSWETIYYVGNGSSEYKDEPGRGLILPAIGLGFEARVYKGLHFKQSFGGTALFDRQYVNSHGLSFLETFNGIGFSLRMSLLYKF